MTPAVSSRIFRRVPRPSDLALLQRLRIQNITLWMDDLLAHPREAEPLLQMLKNRGMRVPAVHLPTMAGGRPIELVETSADVYQQAFDLMAPFQPRVAIAHIAAQQSDALEQLTDLANDRGITLAFEADVNQYSTLPNMLKLLRELDSTHGLCLDLSRTRLELDEIRALARSIRWLEVSAQRDGWRHAPPLETDRHIREEMQVMQGLAYVNYEVLPASSEHLSPGDAELTMLLRQVSAWDRGDDGQTKFEGPVVPF